MRFWSPRHLPPLNPITFIKRSGSRTRRRGYRLRMVRCTPLPRLPTIPVLLHGVYFSRYQMETTPVKMSGLQPNQQTAWGYHKHFIYTRIRARWVLCPAQSHWIHPHDCFGLESVVETDDFRWDVAPHLSHPHSNVPSFYGIGGAVRSGDDCTEITTMLGVTTKNMSNGELQLYGFWSPLWALSYFAPTRPTPCLGSRTHPCL